MSYQDVAVAVIKNNKGEFLVAKRRENVNLPGLWEFPGGKRQHDETLEDCLNRECQEEIGISVIASRSLLIIPYEYTTGNVMLHVYFVENYEGEPFGAEGQAVQWMDLSDLASLDFPAANRQIIDFLREEFYNTPA